MSLFSREPTEEAIRKKALALIMANFEDNHKGFLTNFGPTPKWCPSKTYAQDLLKETMKDVNVVKALDSVVSAEFINDRVDRLVKDRIAHEVQQAVREDLIEEIVAKINKVQLGEKK